MAKKTEAAPAETPALVTVKVNRQPVCEDGNHYAAGDTFTTTTDRAAALGDLVTITETTPEN